MDYTTSGQALASVPARRFFREKNKRSQMVRKRKTLAYRSSEGWRAQGIPVICSIKKPVESMFYGLFLSLLFTLLFTL